MESERMKRLKEGELIGCLNDSGVTSENFKDFLNQPERSKREDPYLTLQDFADNPLKEELKREMQMIERKILDAVL